MKNLRARNELPRYIQCYGDSGSRDYMHRAYSVLTRWVWQRFASEACIRRLDGPKDRCTLASWRPESRVCHLSHWMTTWLCDLSIGNPVSDTLKQFQTRVVVFFSSTDVRSSDITIKKRKSVAFFIVWRDWADIVLIKYVAVSDFLYCTYF